MPAVPTAAKRNQRLRRGLQWFATALVATATIGCGPEHLRIDPETQQLYPAGMAQCEGLEPTRREAELRVASAPGTGASDTSPPAVPTLAVLTTTHETSSLDTFPATGVGTHTRNRIAAAGDAVLRWLGPPPGRISDAKPNLWWRDGLVAVIHRSDSNLLLLDAPLLTPQAQIALPVDCNPQDAIWLPPPDTSAPGTAPAGTPALLVSCMDRPALMAVQLTNPATIWPAVALAHSASEGDGNPNADHLVFHSATSRIYVTLQHRLGTKARQAGTLAEIDPAAAWQARFSTGPKSPARLLPLPCRNPFTRLVAVPNALVVGCAGDWQRLANAGVAWVPLLQGEQPRMLVTADALGGLPNDLAALPGPSAQWGPLWALLSEPDPNRSLSTRAMRLVRLDATAPDGQASTAVQATTLFKVDGHNLAGLAVAADGVAAVGNRDPRPVSKAGEGATSNHAGAGVYLVTPNGCSAGPIRTGLPPWGIALGPKPEPT